MGIDMVSDRKTFWPGGVEKRVVNLAKSPGGLQLMIKRTEQSSNMLKKLKRTAATRDSSGGRGTRAVLSIQYLSGGAALPAQPRTGRHELNQMCL